MPSSPESYASLLQSMDLLLDGTQCTQLGRWLALVEQAGRVMNLTGLRDPRDMAAELVSESLRLLGDSPLANDCHVLDIGSGNGSPVIPLAVACPQVSFTAVEARSRRTDFLQFAARQMKLTNLQVICSRVEELPESQRGPYDCVTSRAFASPALFIAIAGGLLSTAGQVRGICGDTEAEVRAAAAEHGLDTAWLERYQHAGRTRIAYRLTRSGD